MQRSCKPVRHVAIRSLAASMAIILLLVTASVYARSVPHSVHEHSSHHKSTHATVLCTWMCAAGQVLDGATAALPHAGGLVALFILPAPDEPPTVPLLSAASRAPPALLT